MPTKASHPPRRPDAKPRSSSSFGGSTTRSGETRVTSMVARSVTSRSLASCACSDSRSASRRASSASTCTTSPIVSARDEQDADPVDAALLRADPAVDVGDLGGDVLGAALPVELLAQPADRLQGRAERRRRHPQGERGLAEPRVARVGGGLLGEHDPVGPGGQRLGAVRRPAHVGDAHRDRPAVDHVPVAGQDPGRRAGAGRATGGVAGRVTGAASGAGGLLFETAVARRRRQRRWRRRRPSRRRRCTRRATRRGARRRLPRRGGGGRSGEC